MPWTVPDDGEGANTIQSILYQEDLDVLVAGIARTDYVVSGCAVTPNALLVLNVAAGLAISNGIHFSVAAATPSVGAADATNPRIDLIVVTSAGAAAVRAGTAAAAPKPPTRTANDVVLAQIYVAAFDTAIGATEITDRRMLIPFGPHCFSLGSSATANSTTTGAEITGLTIPVGVGTYQFQYTIRYQAAATTTGVAFAVNHTGTAAVFAANLSLMESTTAASTGAATQAGFATTTLRLMSGSSTRTKATTAVNLGASISVDSINSDMLAIIDGFIIVTADGNLALWHASEVAASSQVMAGTQLILTRTR